MWRRAMLSLGQRLLHMPATATMGCPKPLTAARSRKQLQRPTLCCCGRLLGLALRLLLLRHLNILHAGTSAEELVIAAARSG